MGYAYFFSMIYFREQINGSYHHHNALATAWLFFSHPSVHYPVAGIQSPVSSGKTFSRIALTSRDCPTNQPPTSSN